MKFGFLDPWHLFLPLEAGHIISISGSGGKTSLLRAIVGVYRDLGVPAAASTTTRTEPVEGFASCEPSSMGHAAASAAGAEIFVCDGALEDGKWAGLTAAAVDNLEDLLPGHVLVVEVDGAAKMPFKLYREGEPVWPERTSLAIVVMGVGAIGERAAEVVYRLAEPGVADPAGAAPSDVWVWEHAWAALMGDGGYLDHVPAGIPVVLALTGLEAQPDSVGLFDFAARVMLHPRLPLILLCSKLDSGLSLRTAFREDVGDDAT